MFLFQNRRPSGYTLIAAEAPWPWGIRRFPRALFVSPSTSYKRAPVAPACSGRGMPCACVTPAIAVPWRLPPGMWEWPFAVRNWHATGIVIAISAKQTAPISIGASGMHRKRNDRKCHGPNSNRAARPPQPTQRGKRMARRKSLASERGTERW